MQHPDPLDAQPRKEKSATGLPVAILAALLALVCVSSLAAQNPAPIPAPPAQTPPRFVIVLDAAHGGDDSGGRFSDGQDEKSVDLAFSVRLRSLLSARGIQVVTTREQDRTLSPADRAEVANRASAQACISLHSAESGYGVHIFTSSLGPAQSSTQSPTQSGAHFAAWKTAQSAAVTRSLTLAGVLNSALSQAGVNVTLSRTTLPGIDSMTCPAVVLELAPERDSSHKIVSEPGSADYQARIAQTIATALLQWKTADGKTEAGQP
jgi:N-acetylmuramoyl-L-alanine amidase